MPRKTNRTQSIMKHTKLPPKSNLPTATPKAATTEAVSVALPASPVVVAEVKAPAQPTVAPASAAAALLQTDVQARNTVVMEHSVSVQNLIQSLRDPNADVARDAAQELGNLKDAAAVVPLIAVIANTDGYFHNVVRAAAAESLGRIGDTRAVEPLLVLSRDTMAEASAEAVRALALLNDQRAVAPLIDIVQNQYGFFLPIVRRAAVIALAKLGGPAATAALRVVSSNPQEDPVIRQAATSAIARV